MQDRDALIHFGNGPGGQSASFRAPRALIRANHAAEVPGAFAAMAAARAQGLWLAGYASYELGYALEPRLFPLMPTDRELPLLLFGVFDRVDHEDLPAGEGHLDRFVPRCGFDAYRTAFDQLKTLIAAGDCYQANLTFPLDGRWSGSPAGIYAALAGRQRVGHGALVDLGDGAALVSRSPELFFRLTANGQIETRPMKGTAPRGDDPHADADLKRALWASEKDRAENLMIVDLLRNDIGRISRIGSVRVPELFAIETYATVHQMVSRVTGELLPGTGIDAIFRALFPCGSVTGAPKIRAMEIIRALEPAPREAYCGAIGWMAPDGSAEFNVAIRTLILHPDGRAVLNVGGGIVQDSTAQSEYEEALWKTRFAQV